MAPTHYMNQCWLIVNWTLAENFSEILIKTQQFQQEDAFESVGIGADKREAHLSADICQMCVYQYHITYQYMDLCSFISNTMAPALTIDARHSTNESLYIWTWPQWQSRHVKHYNNTI